MDLVETDDAGFARPGPQETEAVAALAYLFGFPLVLMDATREAATGGAGVRPNQLSHATDLPDDSSSGADLRATSDMLVSSAWLDLSGEPVVLRVPETGGRTCLVQVLDAWTNVFASLGTRATDGRGGTFALVGPSWRGGSVGDLQTLRAPTNLAWLGAWTECAGPQDLAAAREAQRLLDLRPSRTTDSGPPPVFQGRRPPPGPGAIRPVDQLLRMGAATFLARLAHLMATNAAAPEDRPILDQLARIGLVPGRPRNLAALGPGLTPALVDGVARGRAALSVAATRLPSALANGWMVRRELGRYGTDFVRRAAVAAVDLGAHLPEDAITVVAPVDGTGRALSGANQYRLRFGPGSLPPVDGFWSLAISERSPAPAGSPPRRVALRSSDPLRFEADGSLEILVQQIDPGEDARANWLPAPAEGFAIALRLYTPRAAVLDNAWKPPPLVRQAEAS